MRARRVTRRAVGGSLLIALCLLWSCAKMAAPPGGPEDKIGPFVVSHDPSADATNVARRLVARIEFSEPVNRTSVESSLFLSPDPRQRLRYRWRGNVLELIYLDPLDENRTYVITVGAQAKDIRGNPAGQPSTIAFSTGPQIDRGRIDGWVSVTESPTAISAWAYQLIGDTIVDPAQRAADYQAEPDQTGRFRFAYMRTGRYRVFAVRDRDFNGLWNPAAEEIGVAPWNVSVTDSTLPWVSFKPSNQDTAAPAIRSAKAVNQRQIDVRITVPVDSFSASFLSQDQTIAPLDLCKDRVDVDTWHLFLEQELHPGTWVISGSGISPRGVQWSDSEIVEIRQRADTTRPAILYSDPDLKRRARTLRKTLYLEFAEPVRLDSVFLDSITFKSTAKDTGFAIFESRLPRIVEVVPAPSFELGRDYTVTFDGRAIRDLAGNTFADSTTQLRFGIYSSDSLGTLILHVITPEPGQYLFTLYFAAKHEFLETRVAEAPGDVVFPDLPAGTYVIETAHDINRNSRCDVGSVIPLTYSEPFIMPPDTFAIRARWEQETSLSWPEHR